MTHRREPLAPVTGLAWGLMLSIPLWIVIFLTVGIFCG
jgi:hypothetical protein